MGLGSQVDSREVEKDLMCDCVGALPGPAATEWSDGMTVKSARHEKFPCPCCGYRVFDIGLGSQLICPVCFWEDGETQLRWPLLEGCSNKVSLVEAQANYQLLEASEERFLTKVRGAEECESRPG